MEAWEINEDKYEHPTVFIADDDEAVRSGIADLVAEMGLAVETFGSGEEFLKAYDSTRPGCMILDLQMPGMTGLELQKQLAASGTVLPVIIITGHGYVAASVQAMKLGAVDFIEKPFRQHVLCEAITKAISRDRYLRHKSVLKANIRSKFDSLSLREREVMGLLIAGMTDKQIAAKLEVSHRAIAFHRLHILEKMGVGSTVELAKLMAAVD